MSWPRNTDYNEAIQNLCSSVSDEELRAGQPALNSLGVPFPYSGNFADVYKVHCPQTGNTWAVKCFTREVPGLVERYREIGSHLARARLPFMVDFHFVEPGIRIGRTWYAFLKMRWVEGLNLNQFVGEYLDRPKALRQLLELWVKLAARLREARVAHADLQHGNVLLVPAGDKGQLGLKLIDYDGMFVPSLSSKRSGEAGHPAYQHPRRLDDHIYDGEVDRFSHLAIYSAVRCLAACGAELWQRFDNGDNLLFREVDYRAPAESEVFRHLCDSPNADVRAAAGRLALATQVPPGQVPLLEEITDNGRVRALSASEETSLGRLFGIAPKVVVSAVSGTVPPTLDSELTGELPLAPSALLSPGTAAQGEAAASWWSNPVSPFDSLEKLAEIERSAPPLLQPAIIEAIKRRERDEPLPPGRLDDAVTVLAKRFDISKRAVISYSIVAAGLLVVLLLIVILIAFLPSRESPQSADSATFPSIAENAAGDTDNTLPAAPKVDRPKPAVAPFDAIEAKAHQARWAKSLEVPSLQTNSIGMKMLLIPPGEFLMGSPDLEGESSEHPQHRVRITKPFWLGVHEVTVGQFRKFAEATNHSNTEWHNAFPSQSDEYPVVNVSWDDANAFLRWLSGKEGKTYRLPTEAEWEYACRAETTSKFSFGDDEKNLGDYAWYHGNSGSTTHPVGGKNANAWGLYDMHGNVWEWCQDWYGSGYDSQSPADDPQGPSSAAFRVLRGGSWRGAASNSRSAYRSECLPGVRLRLNGFRAARTLQDQRSETASVEKKDQASPGLPKPAPIDVVQPKPVEPRLAASKPPELAVAPFTEAEAKAHRDRWAKFLTVPGAETNSIAMKLVLIPPGEFTMGSPGSEGESNEHPQHRVRITKPFWLGVHEVTVGQFRQFANATNHPSTQWRTAFSGQTDEYPVVNVSWDDANAFLKWLSGKEGKLYRLPTEAEWEYTCRAGTTSRYSFGDDEKNLGDYAWYDGNSGRTTHPVRGKKTHPVGGKKTHPVGGKNANAWGLYDMHGNGWEWCGDWYAPYPDAQPAVDPGGPVTGQLRVVRGGSWYNLGQDCRAAYRNWVLPADRNIYLGFRVAAVRDIELQARQGRQPK